ncbi:MFS transporter [Sphingopyxis sp.]|uniref:MFS transporter n=1 Tax=Sphingopyxis sp. TaxID=1908224 RepID=UPI003BAB2BD2
MSSEGGGASRGPALGYGYYIVVLLMLAYMLSFLDRVLISLLVEPIRTEFGLGDTEIGLLVGFGFVLFYTVLGVPFGAAADRTNRRNLIVFGLVGWSLATAGSGLVAGFGGLLLMRALVGVGEATLSPAALSTIADRFPPERLGFAISIYSSGVVLGGGLAMGFGGMIAEWAARTSIDIPGWGMIEGWRLAMLLVGLLGLPLALLLLATMREAPRNDGGRPVPGFGELLATMRRHRAAFATVFIGYGCAVISAYIPLLWGPALLAREHAMGPAEIGLALGVVVGVCGFAGVLTGGILSDRLARRGTVHAPVLLVLATLPPQFLALGTAYLSANTRWVLILLGLGTFLSSILGGLQATTVQLLTPAAMRGRAMAIYLLVVTLLGMGLGPLVIGMLSDHVFGTLPASLATTSAVSLALAAVILWTGRSAVERSIRATSDAA